VADATYADLLGTDILLHYDASDAGSLFSDTSGTTPAVDGGEVECIKPQSDADLQVNLTNSNGPTYRANYASTGYAALQFDGVNDCLVNATPGLLNERFFVLCAFTPISTIGTIWMKGSTNAHLCRLYWNGSASYIWQSLGGSNAINSTTNLVAGKVVVANCFGANQHQIDALGVSQGTQNTTLSASITQNFQLGVANFSGLTQFGNFAFHELILVGADCEWGQVLRAAKIMRDKWGITDPNGFPQKAATTAPQPRIVSPYLAGSA
jgi:hypothetical protein